MEKRPFTFDEAVENPERVDRIEQPIEGRPATVAEVTARMSKLVSDGGMRRPDVIREGPEPYEVSFIWAEEKAIVIVDRREEVEIPELERSA